MYRGIGLAAMIEVTNPSPAFYGVGGARISSLEGATLRLEPTGMVTCLVSVTKQGQGTEGIFAQIAADAVGVRVDRVRVITGDTAITPYGGGTWASRGAGIGGEAVLQSGKVLRANILDVASAILQSGHVVTPTKTSALGAKGAGEAGTAGAPGAIMNAINDALLPFNARVTAQPFTPERVFRALGKV